jgi:superfamily II DNA or RNA helicase
MSDFQLYPHQVGMVQRHKQLLQLRGVTSDRSETGVGKTPAILRAAKELQVPFAVICPKTLISHWRRWCRLMDLKPMEVIGWEACRLGKSSRLFNPHAPVGKSRWLAEWPQIKVLLIFDEAHRAKSHKTLNSRMVSAAAEEGHWLALLSATLVQSPLDLLGLGYPLKLVGSRRDAFSYARRYGVGLNAWKGYADLSTRSQQKALHLELDKIGLRVRKSEICETMCVTQADLVDSDRASSVRMIYETLEEEIKELEAKGAKAIEMITKRLHARQAAELAKVPVFVEEAIRHLEEGARVSMFFCFTESIKAAALMLALPLLNANTALGIITGETPLKERDAVIDAYNFGSLSVLVLNIAAGGEGISLHDQTGEYPRVGLLSIPESSTHLIQALGRNDRVGAKSVGLNRILFCAGTMEETVYENLSRKVKNIETINDGDLSVLSKVLQ